MPDVKAELKDIVNQLRRQVDNGGVIRPETIGRLAAVVDSIDTPAEQPPPEPEPETTPAPAKRESKRAG